MTLSFSNYLWVCIDGAEYHCTVSVSLIFQGNSCEASGLFRWPERYQVQPAGEAMSVRGAEPVIVKRERATQSLLYSDLHLKVRNAAEHLAPRLFGPCSLLHMTCNQPACKVWKMCCVRAKPWNGFFSSGLFPLLFATSSSSSEFWLTCQGFCIFEKSSRVAAGLLFMPRSLTSRSVYFPPQEHYSVLILFLPYEEWDFLLKRIQMEGLFTWI